MDEALEALALDWTNPGLTHPQDAIVLVDTNRRSETANRLLQQKRIDAECLDTSASLEIIDDDKSRGVTYCNRLFRGDRILCTRNHRRNGLELENGTLGTVIGLNTWRKTISVQLDDGRRTIIPVQKYPHIRLGYAMTVYKAQGSTVPNVLVLANGDKECLPLSYVEATRGVLVTRFYTEKAYLDETREQIHESRLAKQMSRKPDLRLVTDLLAEAPPSLPPREVHNTTAADQPQQKERPIMHVAEMPSSFWMVKTPLPGSALADVCFRCDFTEFISLCRPVGNLRSRHIVGVYTRQEDAVAAATRLLNAPPQPDPATSVKTDYSQIESSGFPAEFWLVKMPTVGADINDICSDCDFKELARHVLFGLRPNQIAGIYGTEAAAIATASKLLEAVRQPDAADTLNAHDHARHNKSGMPSSFWVVTKPGAGYEMNDMCFECDVKKLALHHGRLTPN